MKAGKSLKLTLVALVATLSGMAITNSCLAQSGLVAWAEFSILSFDPNKDYGSIVAKLATIFQERLEGHVDPNEFNICHRQETINIEINVLVEDTSKLKETIPNLTKLKRTIRELILDIAQEEFKNKLALTEMKLKVWTKKRGEDEASKEKTTKKTLSRETEGQEDRVALFDVRFSTDEKGQRKCWADVIDVPLHKLLTMLSKGGGINFAIRPEAVFAPVNLSLRDVTIETVLKAALESARVELGKRVGYCVIGRGLDKKEKWEKKQ